LALNPDRAITCSGRQPPSNASTATSVGKHVGFDCLRRTCCFGAPKVALCPPTPVNYPG
jgi:hypothetical protein